MKLQVSVQVWMLAILPLVMLPQKPAESEQGVRSTNAGSAMSGRRLANYVLGPGDEITIISTYAPEIAKPVRVSTSGDINLPMIGKFQAAGRTLQELESDVNERLRKYVKQPDAALNLTQFKSQPVTVLGAVGSPGVLQLEGVKTLVEVLSLAGGIKQDAGYRVKITRRLEWGNIPLPTAKVEGEVSVAEVDIRAIENATNPQENIQIFPYDIISIARAEVVYVIGEGVKQPGAFTLMDRKGLSIIEAMARAQGPTPTANLKGARIIHPVPGENRVETTINVKDIMNGKARDVVLQANDIFYVPKSELKGTARKTLETVISMTTGVIIYRAY